MGTNWHATHPELDHGTHPKLDSLQDTVVIGSARERQHRASVETEVTVMSMLLLLVNLGIMVILCGFFYQAVLARSTGLLVCTVACDTTCFFCCFLTVFTSIKPIAGGQSTLGGWISMILSVFQIFVLVGLIVRAMLFNKALRKINSRIVIGSPILSYVPGPVVYGASLGQPSGQVVVGMPVHVQLDSTGCAQGVP